MGCADPKVQTIIQAVIKKPKFYYLWCYMKYLGSIVSCGRIFCQTSKFISFRKRIISLKTYGSSLDKSLKIDVFEDLKTRKESNKIHSLPYDLL